MDPVIETSPPDIDLDRMRSAERAFEAGDYAALRRLLADSDPATRSSLRAQRLLAVTGVDPMWPALLIGCAMLLALIAWRYYAG